jgi:hypothetical protein
MGRRQRHRHRASGLGGLRAQVLRGGLRSRGRSFSTVGGSPDSCRKWSLLRDYSRENVVSHNDIHDSGRVTPGYGEGVYLGLSRSNWSAPQSRTGGQPDTSDRSLGRRQPQGRDHRRCRLRERLGRQRAERGVRRLVSGRRRQRLHGREQLRCEERKRPRGRLADTHPGDRFGCWECLQGPMRQRSTDRDTRSTCRRRPRATWACRDPAVVEERAKRASRNRMNRPGESGELIRWKDHSHGTTLEVLPGAA